MANISAKMDDENIRVNVDGQADLSKEYPTVKGEVKIDELNLTALNLYSDSLRIKGDIKVDMLSTRPRSGAQWRAADRLVGDRG